MLTSSVWRENSRWWFSGGLLAGGLTTGFLAVTVGSLLARPFTPLAVEVGLSVMAFGVIAVNEFGLWRFPLPQNGRQVPDSIIDDGPRYGALQFGFEMGTGMRTFMTSGLPHALAVILLLGASWPAALLAGVGFGGGRALVTLFRHAHLDEGAWDKALRKWERPIRITLTFVYAAALAIIVLGLVHNPAGESRT